MRRSLQSTLFICVVLVLCAGSVRAQDGLYIKRFFGFDGFLAGAPATDGGYLAALELNSDELYLGDTALLRLSPTGAVQWKRILSNTLKDHIYGIVQMADGGWVAVGDTYECPMSRLCYGHPVILRLDASGKIIWQKTLDTVEKDGRCCSNVIRFGDGVLLTGSIVINRSDDVLLIALDGSGNLLWSKAYGTSRGERPGAIIPSCDGGALVFGSVEAGPMDEDLFAMKVGTQGGVLWTRRYHTPELDSVMAAAPSGCSSFVGALSGSRGIVLKLNGDGQPAWRRAVTIAGRNMLIRSVEAQNGVLVAGSDWSAGIILKLDPAGSLLWGREYAGAGAGEIGEVARNSAGGFSLGGVSYESARDAMVVAHLNSEGGSGHCPLLMPVSAASTAIAVQPSLIKFGASVVTLKISDLEMRYSNRGFESSVCR